jgi:CHAT domain-containing protein/Tfp pilus assembly protein PilF
MRYSCLLLCIISQLCFLPSYSQRKAKVDTVAAFRAFDEGERLRKAVKNDSSITSYQVAAEGYRAYALSLPDNQKWAKAKNRAWEQHFSAQGYIGFCLNSKGQSENALKLLMEAKAACSQVLGDSNVAMAAIANSLGSAYFSQSKYDKALQCYQHSIAILKQNFGKHHPKVANSYSNIGVVYIRLGQPIIALEYNFQALTILKKALGEQHSHVAASYNNIGNVYIDQGQYGQALKYHQQALVILSLVLGKQHPEVATSYNNIGIVFLRQGQYVQALEYHQQALAIQKQAFGEQHPTVANTYNNIGNVYKVQGLYAQALEYYQQALAIRKQVLGENHPNLAIIYNNMGSLFSNKGQYAQAMEYYQKVLAIRKLALGDEHPEVATSYSNIGNVYKEQGQYVLGLKYYQQALDIRKFAFGEQHPDVAITYNNIGAVYSYQGQYPSAIEAYKLSLNAYLPNYSTNSYRSLRSNSPEVLKCSLMNLPLTLLLRNTPGDDTFALSSIRFADRYIDSLRQNYTYENDKLELGANANQLYQVAIDVAKWNKQDEEAFYYSEKNKASVLAQSLNEATALKLGGIPDSLMEKDKELRTLVAFYTKASIDEELRCPKCDSAKLANLKNGLFTHQQQHTALKTRLESEFPQYFALKYKDAKISVKEVQQGFLAENPTSAILEYLLGDTVLYAFCITKDKYAFHRQSLDSTRFKKTNALSLEVKKLARALADVNLQRDHTSVLSQPASTLYDYLIKPFEQQIQGKELIIIPDGELNKIPFEILVKPDISLKSARKWQDLPYLIQQHNISYHYSGRLLLDDWQKNKTQPVKSSGFVAFAPVFNDSATGQIVSNESSIEQSYLAYVSRSDTTSRAFMSDGKFITSLPGTEREVKAIYELFAQQNQPAKYYLNDQANESTVKSINLKPFKYLHFATHGLTDEDRPTQSCLILAQKPDSTADNLLTSSEMYGLEMDAELVVLSACQTGKGTLKAGEGIIGLTRGLLYAGARNLMVSQWNVNDASTAELMTKFYTKVLAGQSNRQALREAKLELLNSKFACPYFWAAFVLVGR